MSQTEGVMIYQDGLAKCTTIEEEAMVEMTDKNDYALDIKMSNRAFSDITCVQVENNHLVGD